MALARKDVGEILVSKGYMTQDQLNQVRVAQKNAPGEIGKIAKEFGFVTDKQVLECKAEAYNYLFFDFEKSMSSIDPKVAIMIPEQIARRCKAIALGKKKDRIFVCFANPNDVKSIQDVKLSLSNAPIQVCIGSEDEIMDSIGKFYKSVSEGGGIVPVHSDKEGFLADPTQGSREGGLVDGGERESGLSTEVKKDLIDIQGDVVDTDDDDEESDEQNTAPIVRLAYSIIQLAIKDGASDIHVEPQRDNVRVRYRIDGVLHEVMPLPKYVDKPLTSRFKIMSDMNIAERRAPQDGRIGIMMDKKDYDLRVSCLPTVYGEKIVMRILDKSSVLLGLNKLGFNADVQSELEEIITQPNGMLLMTGPTGSGKTTTLYSILHKLNTIEKNILTVEDPVEYQLPGIAQVHVNKKAGLTFATALRSFLRQDPDIIMVGEMRDYETASIAIESALTGHFVLSTLHTNDAPSSVIRLADMGVEEYLISATVVGILAQRLARRICNNCKTSYEVKASELRRFGYKDLDDNDTVTLYRGVGCEKCRNTGYKGRCGIHELMTVNDEVREHIVRKSPVSNIREAAKAAGMHELKEDGLMKVLEGITTPDEVMRVVFTAGT